MSFKNFLSKILRVFEFLGFDARQTRSLRYLPRFFSHKRTFLQSGGSITRHYPILTDYDDAAGTAKGHYFHQDLLVAGFIHKANPKRHIDIGSRIDGFVAHVASWREIEVMDIRPLQSGVHSNIKFFQNDLMSDVGQTETADSISCLHAIEHFGLGRYGDPVDSNGHLRGFNNILKMLKKSGLLYISFPIGTANEVHFNAHRIFKADDIFSWADPDVELELARFDFVDDAGDLHLDQPVSRALTNVTHGCGIYTFKKLPVQ